MSVFQVWTNLEIFTSTHRSQPEKPYGNLSDSRWQASVSGRHPWALEWVEATMTRLYLGKVGLVLRGLKRMQAQSDEAAKAIANCWAYLDAHRGRTAYQKLRRGGYPLGSGGIESSNKFICHVRLKRSGAWWYEANSNHMLALRCAK